MHYEIDEYVDCWYDDESVNLNTVFSSHPGGRRDLQTTDHTIYFAGGYFACAQFWEKMRPSSTDRVLSRIASIVHGSPDIINFRNRQSALCGYELFLARTAFSRQLMGVCCGGWSSSG